MGSFSKLPNGKYRARYRDPDGVQRAKHFVKRCDAETWLTSIESTKLEGTYVSPAAGKQTFGTYANEWASRQMHRRSTKALVAQHMRNHIFPAFEKRALASVRSSEIQLFVKALTSTLSPATVEVVYRYLASVFLSAVDARILARTPCRGIKLPKKEHPLVNPLATENVVAIADAVPERYRALVLCAAGTGLRQGDAFGLTVGYLDLLRRQVRVEQQLVQIVGEPEFGPPKTKASRRKVPVPDVVVEVGLAPGDVWGGGKRPGFFTDDQGRALRRSRFSAKVWRPAVAASDVPLGTVFHDLRHYYASLLIHAGESVKTVQARMGHASAMETLDTYGHLWPDSEDRTRNVVQAAFGEVASGPGEDPLRTPSSA